MSDRQYTPPDEWDDDDTEPEDGYPEAWCKHCGGTGYIYLDDVSFADCLYCL